MAETLLLTTTRVSTYRGQEPLTAASGFFFEASSGLYLVTSRHVLHDPPSGHFPDRAELTLHLDARDLTRTAPVSLPLYRDARAEWIEGSDSGGAIDVAALRIDRGRLPPGAVFHAFGAGHLLQDFGAIEVGAQLAVVGFPLGFFDTVHHLPVARNAAVASAFGVRFQGEGYFLTDARLHRGASGGPVVARDDTLGVVPWRLLGIHSARMDMGDRDALQDETLGLNTAWYADILLTLTGEQRVRHDAGTGPRQGA